MRDQIQVAANTSANPVFSGPGDSGSAVIDDMTQNDLIGILWGGSGDLFHPKGYYSALTPIFAVMDALDVDVVTVPKRKEKEREKGGHPSGIEKDPLENLTLHRKIAIEAALSGLMDETEAFPGLASSSGPLEDLSRAPDATEAGQHHFIPARYRQRAPDGRTGQAQEAIGTHLDESNVGPPKMAE